MAGKEKEVTLTPNAGERTPQWSHHETAELIRIRGGVLENDFSASKILWETVSSRMKNIGFTRTPHQCKCKWKNLLLRYKGKERSDPDNGKQFPFFEELHAVFSERSKTMHQSFSESHSVFVKSRKRTKSNSVDQFSDDYSQDEGDQGDDSGDKGLLKSSNLQKRRAKQYIDKSAEPVGGTFLDISSSSNSIHEMLKMLLQQQHRFEMQWRESMVKHRHERDLFEQEWRLSMEKIERDRLAMEQQWMEREEQRKMQEEIRAEKRDALLTTLLDKLSSEDQL